MAEFRVSDRVAFRKADWDDVLPIAMNARQADTDEVYAWSRQSIVDALAFGLQFSDVCVTATLDGNPEVMFGVGTTSLLGGVASPWMLGTNKIDENRKVFWRGSVLWIESLRQRYQILQNHVDDRHEQSKRWLTRLGFKLGEPKRMGYQGLPFRPFEMRSV